MKFNTTYKKILLSTILLISILINLCPFNTQAANSEVSLEGRMFDFTEDSNYEIHDVKKGIEIKDANTYGVFSIKGDAVNAGEKDKVPSYVVNDGKMELSYTYDDALLNGNVDKWHIVEDNSKKISNFKIEEKIKNGVIIVQTSNDRKNWNNVTVIANAFETEPNRKKPIYKATDLELINGCFYRIIVAYKMGIRTKDSNFLFINTDKYEYKKRAEVYEFFACSNNQSNSSVQTAPYEFSEKVRVKDFDNYSGEQPIKKSDPHHGWDLGKFLISGYTSDREHESEGLVFLKNVGDKVTLSFKLNENIDCLRGNEDLFISTDTDGYDQYFEQGPMDFGKGALFIKYTDRNNQSKITRYTNFLEANTSVGADTQVGLFEEGDYEVALDYEITNNLLIDKVYHYRIFFKFAVRNSNCMVYPIDIATGNELTNSSMTENGFRLDLAKSKYLDINIKREILKESADGMIEDTRFNGAARDGAEYSDEGIYTITVSNRYTKEFTVKKIYVGKNNIVKAHMTTGLSIPEINNLLAEGATISNDGFITPTGTTSLENSDNNDDQTNKNQNDTFKTLFVVFIVLAGLIIAFISILLFRKKSTKNTRLTDNIETGDNE